MTVRTVYVVDDNTEFRESAVWWLQGAGFEVESYASPHAALRALSQPRSNACLLLDVRMPEMSGLEVHEKLRERGIHLPVVYMTGHGDVPLAVAAMRKGAITFLEKPFDDAALESALALAFDACEASPAALQAAKVASPQAPTATAIAAVAPDEAAFIRRWARLTAREREVVDWVVKGKLNKVIADLLGISIKTVELHRKNAMAKMEARSVIELTKLMVTGRVS